MVTLDTNAQRWNIHECWTSDRCLWDIIRFSHFQGLCTLEGTEITPYRFKGNGLERTVFKKCLILLLSCIDVPLWTTGAQFFPVKAVGASWVFNCRIASLALQKCCCGDSAKSASPTLLWSTATGFDWLFCIFSGTNDNCWIKCPTIYQQLHQWKIQLTEACAQFSAHLWAQKHCLIANSSCKHLLRISF